MRLIENLYLTEGGEILFENDPRGRTCIGKRGDEISEEDAKKYGIIDGTISVPHPVTKSPAPPVPGVIEAPQNVRVAAKRTKA